MVLNPLLHIFIAHLYTHISQNREVRTIGTQNYSSTALNVQSLPEI